MNINILFSSRCSGYGRGIASFVCLYELACYVPATWSSFSSTLNAAGPLLFVERAFVETTRGVESLTMNAIVKHGTRNAAGCLKAT